MTDDRGGPVDEAFDRKVADLLVALRKVPPRRGISYRGRTADSSFGREGQVLVTRLLTATSRDVRVATENFTTAGLYVVVGRTGRDIESWSRHPHEQEVVFLPATMFLVVKSARVGDLPVTIVEQLDPEQDEGEPVATLDEVARLTARRVHEGRAADAVEVTSPGKFAGDVE